MLIYVDDNITGNDKVGITFIPSLSN